MIKISKQNEAKLIVETDDRGYLRELYEYYSFFAEGYRFMPAYRNKIWDGKIRLFDLRNQQLPHGLLKQTHQFCSERGYKLKLDENVKHEWTPSGDLKKYIDGMSISINGKIISPRDYQLNAAIHGLRHRRCILLSPTGSGKSLIIYIMMRYYLDKLGRAYIN